MRKPGAFNLLLYRGDSYVWRFRIWQDKAFTIPSDLTGATAAAQFRDQPGGLVVVTFATEVVLPNIVDMAMTADQWEGAPAAGTWDLRLTRPDASVRTVLKGLVQVTADTSNSAPLMEART
jgi:hypothetical protein